MSARIQMSRLPGLLLIGFLGACSSSVNVAPTVNIPPVPPPPPPPVTESVTALGVIAAMDSVTVNGVRYETDSTTVTINGQLSGLDDLELGQIVSLEGTIEVDGPRGTADRIDYEATVLGPVESLDATLGQMIVMGQTVLIDADTMFDPSVDPSTLSGLSVGSNAQISGFLNEVGEIIATRIEPDTASPGVQIIGSISGLDIANMLFSINRLTVDYGNATLIDLPGGIPANGMFVIARGTIADGILNVDQIAGLYDLDNSTPGERTQAQGLITRFGSATDFDLNGAPITTDSGTAFVNGTIDDLQVNAEITLDGEVAANGGRILANEINFGRVASPTTTVTFDLDNFTDISIFSVFFVEVTQDSDFLVEVTIDSDDVNRLDVTQNGATLNIGLAQGTGNANIETIRAVVTLPQLNTINLDGVIDVVLNDFNQTQLGVDVDGVSRLRSDSLMVQSLNARVAGVSQLDFGDVRPIGSATIDVSGVSTATVNMDIGSTLNGSVMGPSSLFYYGTDVSVNVTASGLSVLRKLGETRP